MPVSDDNSITQRFKNDGKIKIHKFIQIKQYLKHNLKIFSEYFKRFLDGSIQTTNQVLSKSMTVSEQLNLLTEGVAQIDAEIQKLISVNHEDLLSQATWIDKLEGVLGSMSSHIQVP